MNKNNRILITVVFVLFILASCTPTSQPTNSILKGETPQETDPIIVQPGFTSTPAEIETEELEPSPSSQSDSSPQKNPDPTMIPCSGDPTSPNQEGPFYKTGSPKRESLIDNGMAGISILIIGRVFDQDCNTLSGVKLDFWLANVDGEYDNVGYTLRGHQFTDENGYYSIESIEPTPYTGRPSHIHVKLFALDGKELLTTQMYFPGSESSVDVLNSPDLLVTYLEADSTGRQQVLFNFIVQD